MKDEYEIGVFVYEGRVRERLLVSVVAAARVGVLVEQRHEEKMEEEQEQEWKAIIISCCCSCGSIRYRLHCTPFLRPLILVSWHSRVAAPGNPTCVASR